MSDIVERLRAAEAKATKGPWFREKPATDTDGYATGVVIAATPPRQTIYATPPGGSFPSADADFIAICREGVPALLAEYDRLRALLAEREQVLWRVSIDATLLGGRISPDTRRAVDKLLPDPTPPSPHKGG
jgi:hypothetical protein